MSSKLVCCYPPNVQTSIDEFYFPVLYFVNVDLRSSATKYNIPGNISFDDAVLRILLDHLDPSHMRTSYITVLVLRFVSLAAAFIDMSTKSCVMFVVYFCDDDVIYVARCSHGVVLLDLAELSA